MTKPALTRLPRPTPVRAAIAALCLMLGGCSSISGWWNSEKDDYHAASKRTQPLEVPPDLSQLQQDSRYMPQGGVIAASDIAHGASAPAAAAVAPKPAGSAPAEVALNTSGNVHLVRQGASRWLETPDAPETVWPRVRQFWIDRGFTLAIEDPKVGILETDWKLDDSGAPQGFFKDQIAKILGNVVDTGLRDRFRVRLERTATGGTEIYLTQFGSREELVGWQKSDTQWLPRPNDAVLEAQVLSQLMLSLGGVPDVNLAAVPASAASAGAASVAVSTAPGAASAPAAIDPHARARVIAGQPAATLQLDDTFDRSWRRIGLALDHGGFTVEDRDRAQGLYYVRFVDAQAAAKDDSAFLARIKGWFGQSAPSPLGKYRIQIKATGDSCTASVLNDKGQPSDDENAQHIVKLLVDDLK